MTISPLTFAFAAAKHAALAARAAHVNYALETYIAMISVRDACGRHPTILNL